MHSKLKKATKMFVIAASKKYQSGSKVKEFLLEQKAICLVEFQAFDASSKPLT
jgi:hypothetical protein